MIVVLLTLPNRCFALNGRRHRHLGPRTRIDVLRSRFGRTRASKVRLHLSQEAAASLCCTDCNQICTRPKFPGDGTSTRPHLLARRRGRFHYATYNNYGYRHRRSESMRFPNLDMILVQGMHTIGIRNAEAVMFFVWRWLMPCLLSWGG